MGIHRHYDRSFKERAVALSYERNNIKELAAEQGITAERIYKWRREFGEHDTAAFQGHGVERLSDEGRRVKELVKKLNNKELELVLWCARIAAEIQAKHQYYRSIRFGNISIHRNILQQNQTTFCSEEQCEPTPKSHADQRGQCTNE